MQLILIKGLYRFESKMGKSNVNSNDGNQARLVLLLVVVDALPVVDNPLGGLDQRDKLGEVLTELLAVKDLEEVVVFGFLWKTRAMSLGQ